MANFSTAETPSCLLMYHILRLGKIMGSMEAKRQWVILGPRFQALNSQSKLTLTQKILSQFNIIWSLTIGQWGQWEHTLVGKHCLPSSTEVMMNMVSNMARLKVWSSPSQVRSPCFRPEWNALSLSELDIDNTKVKEKFWLLVKRYVPCSKCTMLQVYY